MTRIFQRLISNNLIKHNLTRQLTCRSPPVPDYKTRIAYSHDYDKIMDFMVETYLKTEPSIVNLGCLDATNSPLLIHLMHINIREGLTIIAEDSSTNCIVGAAVNIDTRRNDSERVRQLAECCEPGPASDLIGFFSFCSQQADPWNVYCVDSVFECAHVAVSPDHQNCGIAKRLIEDSWILARDINSLVFRIDCSSKYTAKIAKDFNWRCIFSYPYRRYFDNGDFVFKNVQEPHTEMKIYVDRIKNYKNYRPPIKGKKCKSC